MMRSLAEYVRGEISARVRPGQETSAVVIHRVAQAGDFCAGDPVVLQRQTDPGSQAVQAGVYRQGRYGACVYAQ
jgi:hypothetical protein